MVLLLGCLSICRAGNADADYLDVVPSFELKQEYNDNLFYAVDKTGDFLTTFAPGLELQDKTERLDARLSLSGRGVKYLHKTDYDTIDYSFFGSSEYQVSPRLSLTASAEYERLSGPSREMGTTAIVINTVRRYKQYYSLKNEYRFSPRTTGLIGYAFTQNDYQRAPLQTVSQALPTSPTIPDPPAPPTQPPNEPPPNDGGNSGTPTGVSITQILSSSDVKIHAPTLGLVHVFDERTKGSVNAGYSRYLYKYSTVDNVELTVGVSRALTELWALTVMGGGRYTMSEFSQVVRKYQRFPYQFTDTALPREADHSWGWVGQLALVYSGEANWLNLSFFRDVTQGRLSADEATGVGVDFRHRFTYEMEGNLSAKYQFNRAGNGEFGSNTVNDRVMRFGAGLHYDFNKDISLAGSYDLSFADIAAVKISQNIAMVNLVVKFPMFQ